MTTEQRDETESQRLLTEIGRRFDLAEHNATPERIADAIGAKLGNLCVALEDTRMQRDSYERRARTAEEEVRRLTIDMDGASVVLRQSAQMLLEKDREVERLQTSADEVARLKSSLTDQAKIFASLARRLGCERDEIELALQTCIDRMHDAEERAIVARQEIELLRESMKRFDRRLSDAQRSRTALQRQLNQAHHDSGAAFRERLELKEEIKRIQDLFERSTRLGMRAAVRAESEAKRADRHREALAELALMLAESGRE